MRITESLWRMSKMDDPLIWEADGKVGFIFERSNVMGKGQEDDGRDFPGDNGSNKGDSPYNSGGGPSDKDSSDDDTKEECK